MAAGIFNPEIVDEERQFKLGTVMTDDKGQDWMYVEADAAIGQYDACAVQADFGIVKLTTTNATATPGKMVGVPQVAIPNGDFGWILRKGAGNVNVKASCAANAKLYSHATAGVLDDVTTSSAILILGALLTTARGASDGSAPGFWNNPRTLAS